MQKHCSVAQNNGIGAWKCLEENPGSGGARCGKSGALRGLRSKKKTISRIKTVEVYFATREYPESRDLTFGAQLALWQFSHTVRFLPGDFVSEITDLPAVGLKFKTIKRSGSLWSKFKRVRGYSELYK
ncbi:hypothetical protein C8J57DRAFT_1221282 [Mycena rebaudengoi]|nr:hypothetical protein C8J57DRAFT_1221282 [Mycena rebaudengoi]